MAFSVPQRRLAVLLRQLAEKGCAFQPALANPAAGSAAGEIKGPSGSCLTYVVRGDDPRHPIMEITKLAAEGEHVVEELGNTAFAVAREQRMMVWPCCAEMRRFVELHAAKVSSITLCDFDNQVPGLEISIRLDGLATLRLTDGRRRNPLRRAILLRMREFLQNCMKPEIMASDAGVADSFSSPAVRAILLASTGPVFSSGHDFADFFKASREQQTEVLQACSDVNMLLGRVPQVTVAIVDGLASAGGCQLAASCDLVYASASRARFCLPGSRGGHGFCHTPAVSVAHRATSVRKAFELAMTAEEIDPQEAEKLGLCNRLVAGDPEALEQEVEAVLTKLCKNFSVNTAVGKQTFYRQLQETTLEAKYDLAMPVMLEMFNTPSYVEVMRSFVERRRPKKA